MTIFSIVFVVQRLSHLSNTQKVPGSIPGENIVTFYFSEAHFYEISSQSDMISLKLFSLTQTISTGYFRWSLRLRAKRNDSLLLRCSYLALELLIKNTTFKKNHNYLYHFMHRHLIIICSMYFQDCQRPRRPFKVSQLVRSFARGQKSLLESTRSG